MFCAFITDFSVHNDKYFHKKAEVRMHFEQIYLANSCVRLLKGKLNGGNNKKLLNLHLKSWEYSRRHSDTPMCTCPTDEGECDENVSRADGPRVNETSPMLNTNKKNTTRRLVMLFKIITKLYITILLCI